MNEKLIMNTRVFLEKQLSRLIIYSSFGKIFMGIALILFTNTKKNPFLTLLGILIIVIGPFLVGIFWVTVHNNLL